MRSNSVVEQQRVFDFAGISDDTIVSKNHIFSNVRVVANFAVPANDGWAFDHRAVFDNCALADEYLFTDVSDAFTTILQSGSQICLQIGRDFFESLPGIFASFKDGCMLGLGQIEQIRRFEHGGKIGKERLNPKPKCRIWRCERIFPTADVPTSSLPCLRFKVHSATRNSTLDSECC